MRKKACATLAGVGLVTIVAIVAISLAFWPAHSPKKRIEPGIDVTLLTYEQNIVGSWRRVSLSKNEDDDVYGWRQINAVGKMATRYGDLIYHGTYKLIDKKTIETAYHCYGKDDEINQWTFGFLDGKLIMIHNKYGWMEAYESVPAGTLDP